MITQTIEKTQYDSFGSYQFIQDEELASTVITSQILAGSRIQSSTYRQVVFSDCIFYACDFKGVQFENCIFDNCRFEFSHLKKCHFVNCNFSDCTWIASTSLTSHYKNCDLGMELRSILGSNKNIVQQNQTDDHSTDIYIELLVA